MITTNNVLLTINNRYVKHYKEKGYNVKGGQEIEVKIEDLTYNSNILIEAKCDNCGENKKIQYNAYNRYTKNQSEEYYCQKCNNIKRRVTVKEKYGVENILESDEIREKMKRTMIDKYGNEHALNIPEFIEKMKKTNLEKYGHEYAAQNDNIKKKIENAFMKKYNVKTSLLDKNTQDKITKTNLEKYGVDNVFKLREFRENKLFEKYSVFHPMKSNIIVKKMRKTNIEKYGCENPMSNNIIKNKMIKTKQKLGIYLLESDRDDFYNYRLKIKSLTNKNKKVLFEKWNGYDYYDGEYIKNNIHNDKNYPTIDHKISIKFGFDNNIIPEEISKIENLCITKRGLNSSKGSNCRK
jgi:hypothetical protein